MQCYGHLRGHKNAANAKINFLHTSGADPGGVRGVRTPPLMIDPLLLLLVIIANKVPNSKG